MRPPSASASRSARASRVRVQGSLTRAHDKEVQQMGKLVAFVYGAVAYVVFFGTFLYAIGFVGNLGVPKGIDDGPVGSLGTALLINLLILSLFAIQHSGMARPGFKRWWTRFVPHSVERSTYVLLTSLILLLLFWQWRPIPGVVWSVDGGVGRLVLFGLFALGGAIVLLSTFMIGHFELFGLKRVFDHLRGQAEAPAKFKTPGFYGLVRHPLMTGFIIAFWATPTMTQGHLLFAAVTTTYIVVAIQLEERDLVGLFGDTYRQYRRDVSMLIPLPKQKK